MKRNAEGIADHHFSSSKKVAIRKINNEMENDHHQCWLDLTISSKLLSFKIADIPQKSKYNIIIKPLFEYCFGTSDDQVWEPMEDCDGIEDSDQNCGIINIDWIRDRTFIYDQIFDLVLEKLKILAGKFSLWNNREFMLNFIQFWGKPGDELRSVAEYFRNDRELMIAAVRENGDNIKFASEELRNDFEIVKLALQDNGYALCYLSRELRNNKEIVKAALKKTPSSIEFASDELRNDKELVMIAVEGPLVYQKYVSETLKDDRDVVFKAFSKCVIGIERLNPIFKHDREFLMLISKVNGEEALKFASEELKNDREIVMQAVQENPSAILRASYQLQHDKEIVKLAVMKDGWCLQNVDSIFRDDKEIAELALQSSTSADLISLLSERLRNDTKFISRIVGKKGFTNIPIEFIYDREIMLNSIKLCQSNILHVRPKELRDREFILQVVSNDGSMLGTVGVNFKKDREIILAAVSQNGQSITCFPELFQDKEIVLTASKTYCNFHYFFYGQLPDSFKNDYQFNAQLLKNNWNFIKVLPRKYELDREIAIHRRYDPYSYPNCKKLFVVDRLFAMRIVQKNGNFLHYLCYNFRNDREIVSLAVKQNKEALKYASEELQNDEQILALCKN